MNKESIAIMVNEWLQKQKEWPWVPLNSTNLVEIITMVIDAYDPPLTRLNPSNITVIKND